MAGPRREWGTPYLTGIHPVSRLALMQDDIERRRQKGILPRLAHGAVAFLITFAAAACQGGSGSNGTGQRQVASVSDIDRLLHSTLTPEELSILGNAHDSVVETCMQQLGWDFEIGVTTPEIAQGGPRSLTLFEQWTFSDVAAAQASGFDLRTYIVEMDAFLKRMDAAAGAAHIPDPDHMTPDERERLGLDYFGRDDQRIEIIELDGSKTSVPGGGCLGEADRQVYGDDMALKLRLDDARSTADSDIWSGTLSSDLVNRALAKWKTCISRAGDEFETPPNVFEAAVTAARAGNYESEKRIAVLTATCSTESGLADAIKAAFLSAGNATIPELEDDLLALQQFEEQALERSRSILKTGA